MSEIGGVEAATSRVKFLFNLMTERWKVLADLQVLHVALARYKIQDVLTCFSNCSLYLHIEFPFSSC